MGSNYLAPSWLDTPQLICPGYDAARDRHPCDTHLHQVISQARREDQPSRYVMVDLYGGHIHTSDAAPALPPGLRWSSRRHAVVLVGDCEQHGGFVFVLDQHKGPTYIEGKALGFAETDTLLS